MIVLALFALILLLCFGSFELGKQDIRRRLLAHLGMTPEELAVAAYLKKTDEDFRASIQNTMEQYKAEQTRQQPPQSLDPASLPEPLQSVVKACTEIGYVLGVFYAGLMESLENLLYRIQQVFRRIRPVQQPDSPAWRNVQILRQTREMRHVGQHGIKKQGTFFRLDRRKWKR